MTRSRSDEYWDEITSTDETMTAEGEINDLRVVVAGEIDYRGSLSHSSAPTHFFWSGHQDNRDVVISRSVCSEYNLKDSNSEAVSRSGEEQSNVTAGALGNHRFNASVEGDIIRRVGKNEQSSLQSRELHPHRVSFGTLSSRRLAHFSSSPLSPSPSAQPGDAWKLGNSDYSGPRGDLPFQLDLNQPVPAGTAVCAVPLQVPEQRASLDVALASEQYPLDRYDGGMPPNPAPFISPDQLRQLVRRAASVIDSNISPDGIEPRPNLEGLYVESPELVHACVTAELVGSEADGERLYNRQRTLRSVLRGPENLHHKRAKFFSLPTRRHSASPSSCGLSPSSSSWPGSPLGGERGTHRPPPKPPLLPPSQDDERMESDTTDGDGDDDDQSITVADIEDGEIRMDLTDDLLHKVFSFLDDIALCQAAMVCKQWRVASAHEDFWKILTFEGRHVSHEQVRLLCGRYPKATTLNLKGVPCVDELLVREAMRSLRSLEVLSLGRGLLSDGFFYALAIECPSLQNLSISDAVLGTGGAQEIQLRHESLHRLQIHKCRVLRIAIRCPQLDWLSLNRTGTASAILHCPRLVTLDVSSCHKLSDAGLRAAATACPLLASLDMSNCAYVSDETLREISVACMNLRTLDASYCPNISLEGVRMPMLMELKLQCCEGIISSSMAALSSCAMLEELAMDFCWLLTAVTLDLPRLRQISLTNNRKFVELTLRCPALTKLSLTHCPILNKVDITSSSLQSLVLRQQNGLSSMALQCTQLHEVDLTECEALTNAVCDVFSDGSCCPKLRSLILDSCEGLTNVKLASSSLQSLSLVGCRNIGCLNLSCPLLQQLHLDGCDHLTGASFAPVGLQSLNLGICPHLVTLEVEAFQMTTLDLRGCGVLCQASICCPALMSLDASYCSQLGDDCLAQTTAACSSIQSLVLASCPSVGPVGLLSLKNLRHLTMLDLSYTFLTDLSPIFEACPGLKVLRLSACKYLADTALDALHGGNVLPELRELDLSYGSLGNCAIEGVMALCPQLSHVSLNGCAHVTDLLWERLSSPPFYPASFQNASHIEHPHRGDIMLSDVVFDCQENQDKQLMDFAIRDNCSANGCTNLSGMGDMHAIKGEPAEMLVVPTDLPVLLEELLESELSMDAESIPVRALQNLSCVGCPHIKKVVIPRFAACLHLSFLNLSLSVNIREVHLSCFNLTSLNLSNCAGLVVLELECPRLISLFVQACGIEADMLELAIQGCGLLETLDVRSCSKISCAALTRMRSVCPGLKRLYSTMST